MQMRRPPWTLIAWALVAVALLSVFGWYQLEQLAVAERAACEGDCLFEGALWSHLAVFCLGLAIFTGTAGVSMLVARFRRR